MFVSLAKISLTHLRLCFFLIPSNYAYLAPMDGVVALFTTHSSLLLPRRHFNKHGGNNHLHRGHGRHQGPRPVATVVLLLARPVLHGGGEHGLLYPTRGRLNATVAVAASRTAHLDAAAAFSTACARLDANATDVASRSVRPPPHRRRSRSSATPREAALANSVREIAEVLQQRDGSRFGELMVGEVAELLHPCSAGESEIVAVWRVGDEMCVTLGSCSL